MNPKEEPCNAVTETLELLKLGGEIIDNWKQCEDAVLVVGPTRSGKSTATMIIAGDNTDLLSYETEDGSFLIRNGVDGTTEDKNKEHITTCENTTPSKTIVPRQILQPPFFTKSTLTAFYDFPGFSDTLSTANEIANSYFTRKIADNSKQFKVLLVVDHHSLKRAKYRDDFILLLQHISKFLPNVDRFKDSITFLANRAEQKKNDDKKLIAGIVKFLTDCNFYLENVLKDDDLLNAQKLVWALIKQNEFNKYTRITFLRVPEEAGLVSDIALVQENKKSVLEVIHNNTEYVSKQVGDFCITLSPTAQNDILQITSANNAKIIDLFSEISQLLSAHFAQEQLSTPSFEFKYLQDLPVYFTIIDGLPEYEDSCIEKNAVTLIEKILAPFKEPLPIKIPKTIVEEIEEQAKRIDMFLEPLQKQLGKGFINPSEWVSPLKQFLEEQTFLFKKSSMDLNASVLRRLRENNEIITDYFASKFQDLIHHESESDFPTELRKLMELLEDLQGVGNTKTRALESEPEFEAHQSRIISHFFKNYLEFFERIAPKLGDYNKTQDLLTSALMFYKVEDKLLLKTKRETESRLLLWKLMLQEAFTLDSNIIKQVVRKIEKERITFQIQKLFQEEVIAYFALEFARRNSRAGKFNFDKMEQVKHLKQIYEDIIRAQPEGSLSDFVWKCGHRIFSVIGNTELHLLQSVEEEVESLDLLNKIISNNIQIHIPFWFDPLRNLITDLENALESQIYEYNFETLEEETIATVQGSFISLKNILEDEDLMLRIKLENAKHIAIFARHTVYIDTPASIKLVDLSLSIISPIWVVPDRKGNRIVLEGAPGAPPASAESLDGKGLPGAYGKNGGCAGNFFGVGEHIVGGTLDIKCIGGKGGKGQNGGSGERGMDGDVVDISKIEFDTHDWEFRELGIQTVKLCIHPSPYVMKEVGYGEPLTDTTVVLTRGSNLRVAKKLNEIYYHAGAKRGTKGQKGGKGGGGGKGGSSGEILIYFPPSYNSFFTSGGYNGPNGRSGADGACGADGERGRDAKLTFRCDPKECFISEYVEHDGIDSCKLSVTEPSLNQKIFQNQVRTKAPFHKDKILQLYSAFARTSSFNPLHQISLSSFY